MGLLLAMMLTAVGIGAYGDGPAPTPASKFPELSGPKRGMAGQIHLQVRAFVGGPNWTVGSTVFELKVNL